MGQRFKDEAGNIWEMGPDGQPRFVSASPMNSPMVDPRLQYQVQQAQGQAAAAPYEAPKAQAEATIAQANAGTAGVVAQAEAQKAQADAQRAQAELAKLRAEQGKVDPKSGAYRALQEQIDRVSTLYRQNLQGGLPNKLNDFIPFQSGKDAFDAASAGLVNPFMAAFKVEGQGSQSDADLKQFLEANTPQQGDSDAVIEEKLGNIQRRLNAQLNAPQAPPPAPPSSDGLKLADGKTRSEIDPALKATGQRVGRMVADGVSDDKIKAFLERSGVNPADTSIDRALQYRKTDEYKRWQRANPGKAYPIGPEFYTREIPMSGLRQNVNAAAQSAPGAFVASAGNAVSGGRLDNIAGAFGGDAEMARTGMQLLRSQQPGASFLGDVAGQGAVEMTLGRIPGLQGIMASKWGQRGADAAYGAYSGSGEADGDGLWGGLEGAIVNTGGGMFGRGVQRVAGGALTGVKNDSLKYLNDRDVPLTIGQIARGSNSTTGKAFGGIEERAAGLPIADAIIGSARRRGDEGFNREMFRQIGEPTGVTGTGAIGVPGLAEARNTRNAAYSFLDPARLQRDPAYDAANAATVGKIAGLPDFGGQVGRKLDLVNNSFDPAGELTGRNWQNSVRSLRGDRGKISQKEFGQEAADLLGEAENNLSGLVQRQLPGGIEALANANRVNANYKTAQAALKGRVAQRNGVLTDPTTLNDASIQGAKKFGGLDSALEGNRPFFDLTTAGMDVMPSLTPDSGTAGRSLFYASLPAILGGGAGATYGGISGEGVGEGAAAGASLGAGATVIPTAALAALYSKSTQRAIQKAMLGPRNAKVDLLGQLLKRHPRLAGMFGSAAARDFFYQPELPE